jgi:hypothetical protein
MLGIVVGESAPDVQQTYRTTLAWKYCALPCNAADLLACKENVTDCCAIRDSNRDKVVPASCSRRSEIRQLMLKPVVFSLLIAVALVIPSKADEQLQGQVDRIAKEVGTVVGIELNAPIPVERISGDEFRKIFRSQSETLAPKDRIAGTLRSWQLLGLLPDFEIDFEQLLDLTATTSGATYNPATNSIQLTPGAEKSLSDENAFHELVHAAQDQRHDLKRVHQQLGELASADATIAFKFLLEGEATFWQTLYRRKMTLEEVLKLPPESQTDIFGDERVLTSQEMIRNCDEGGKRNPRMKVLGWTMRLLPPVVSRSLSLAYSKGDNAALRIAKRGGRDALRQSFEDVSKLNTRDILFPDPHNENPRGVTKVQIGSVVDMLGDEWKLKHEDTLGALVLNTMFEDHVDQANSIARSWNGDRIQLWEDGEGGFALLGRVEFETAEAAKLLEAELIGLCREKWMRGTMIQELKSEGTQLAAEANHLVLERRERSVVFVRSSGCKNAAAVASALWRSKGESPKHGQR